MKKTSDYVEVRINGRLLFKYDPARDIVEIKRGATRHQIDLAIYRMVESDQPNMRAPDAKT